MKSGKSMKSSPSSYGPFDIVKRIGLVGYELKLPDEWNIHNVFSCELSEEVCVGS